MARKLKTFQTSLGFYDLAIAAPSMKAALEASGAKSNLFQQGAAKESDDSDVVAATMSKPGVILKRPVGSDGPFKEDADLSALDEAEREHAKRVAAIDAERAAVERKSQAEDARGDKEKGKLQSAGRETRRSIP